MAKEVEVMNEESRISESNTPADIIKTAITAGADLEKLEKLLNLQERYEAIQAKKAYNEAMANFKANPPKIDKDMTVAYGNTKYNHASLANVTEKINSELSKYGLSASWSIKQNGAVSVTCKITHIKGHSEETTLSAPADSSGSKNAIQAIGSTITYLERYSLLALTGLATYEQDDDGRAAGAPVNAEVEYISGEEATEILSICLDLNVDQPKFLSYMKSESIEKILKSDYKKAISALQAKKAKAGK